MLVSLNFMTKTSKFDEEKKILWNFIQNMRSFLASIPYISSYLVINLKNGISLHFKCIADPAGKA